MKTAQRQGFSIAAAVILSSLCLFSLKGCGSGGSGSGGGSTGPFCQGAGVSLDYPTQEAMFTTIDGSIVLTGSINADDQYATWHNYATGASGAATMSNYQCGWYFLGIGYVYLCLYDWGADIPLAYGSNYIAIAGNPSDGSGGGRCITVTRLPDAAGIALDTVHDEVFAARPYDTLVSAYSRTDTGSAAPKRIISGASTGLSYPQIIAIDAVNDELFVVAWSSSDINVYARTASGDAAPIRTISRAIGTGTGYPSGIAVDTVNNEIFATYRNDDGTVNFIDVYARTASGATTPLRSLSSSSGQSGLRSPMQAAVDTVNDEIFVTNIDDRITVYSRTADYSAVPIRTISGASTGLSAPYGIAVDTVHNELFVTNGDASIRVYSRTANGDAGPVRTISGAATGLHAPQDIAVNAVHDEIFVTDGLSSVLVYSRTAGGNATPSRTITY